MATTKPAAAINLIILVLPCLRTLSYGQRGKGKSISNAGQIWLQVLINRLDDD
jgi:hypothetical protein